VADYTPIYTGGSKPREFTAGGTITGGQVVVISAANTVVAGSAASNVVAGVAAFDASSGQKVTVWPLPGATHEVTASAAVAVGDMLVASSAGKVAPIGAGTFGQLIGVAVTAAAGDGIKLEMLGR
jgi:hypothetical protein